MELVCILVEHGKLISPLYRGSGAPGAVPSLKFAISSQPEPDPLAERRALLCLMHMYFHLISGKCSWLWIEFVQSAEGFTFAVH